VRRWLRNLILGWLGLTETVQDLDGRLKDVERHFVTKRDTAGMPTETLADVPLNQRKDFKPRGLTWQQRKAYLEATDGGMRGAVGERLPSTS
jgi:hypothetical protein